MNIIEKFPVTEIIISEDFKNTPPTERKMQYKREHLKNKGVLKKNIIINDENVLIDGYTTYLLAMENGMNDVPVIRGYVEIVEAVHKKGGKAYSWKVPTHLIGAISPGDKCIVQTSSGAKYVRVVNVLRQQYPIQTPKLQNVLRAC